jgi:UDPglucose--hexose-1-phosphate uridylyltransferase
LTEIRIDPISGSRTIIADERSSRPGGAPSCSAPDPIDPAGDPFADGHEQRTPPELFALRPRESAPDSPGWSVRVVPNLYPALISENGIVPAAPTSERRAMTAGGVGPGVAGTELAEPAAHGSNRTAPAASELFASLPGHGAHEVIVNAPQPVLSLAQLSAEQVGLAMEVWRQRISHHAPGSAYVQLIVNERREAGASLPHTHAQLYALPFVPADVARERERFGAYANRTMGGNLLGDLLQEEVRRGERAVAIDEEAVLIAPFASKLPFQLMLIPRRPRPRFEEEGPLGAALLHDGLLRLTRHLGAVPPLNMWVRSAPRGAEHFCWRIDVMPRLTHLAGLELSTGINLNIVAPERAAALLREA